MKDPNKHKRTKLQLFAAACMFISLIISNSSLPYHFKQGVLIVSIVLLLGTGIMAFFKNQKQGN